MDKKFFLGNRERLVASIEDKKCMIIVSSGYLVAKSADENYDFQVNTNFYYLTGILQKETNLVILKDGDDYEEVLFIDKKDPLFEKWIGKRITKKQASLTSGVYTTNIDYKEDFDSELAGYLKEYKTVYLDLEENKNINFNSFALSMKKEIEEKYKGITIKNCYENITKLRMAKQTCEIEEVKKAIRTTKKGIESLMKHAKAGIYEYELEAHFDMVVKQEGNHKYAFKTIAASGVNATTLHYSTNNTKIPEGSLILFDLGAKEGEYSSDITRTFPVNGKYNDLQKKIYNIVLEANEKIIHVAHAGMTLKDLQMICIDTLAEGCLREGLIKRKKDISKYYFHGVSHSIGLDTHDPYIRSIPLPVNAIISDEPGLYFPKYKIGVRIEDDVLIKEDKAINLSKSIIKKVDAIEKFMAK